MRIKMRTLGSGPDGVLQAGKVYDLPAEVAQPLLEGGYAERVVAGSDRPAKTGQVPTPVDDTEAVESPVVRTPGRRREKATEKQAETATDK